MRALVTMTWNPSVFVMLIVVTVGCPPRFGKARGTLV